MYLVLCMTVGVILIVLANISETAFWTGLTFSLAALAMYWANIAPTRVLEPIVPIKITPRTLMLGLRQGSFIKPLAWIAGLLSIAAGYIVLVQFMATSVSNW